MQAVAASMSRCSATSRRWSSCSSGTSSFPKSLPDSVGLWIKRDLPHPEFVTAIVGIGLFMGARVAEQVRAGIAAVGIHLMPAALATGLRPLQAYRLDLLPLGLRAIFGPLTSEFLITVKMSSISLTIGMLELTAQSRHIENYTFHGLEAFAVATVVYLLLGLAVTALMRALDRRVGAPRLRRATRERLRLGRHRPLLAVPGRRHGAQCLAGRASPPPAASCSASASR